MLYATNCKVLAMEIFNRFVHFNEAVFTVKAILDDFEINQVDSNRLPYLSKVF